MHTIFHTHIGREGELFTPEPREAEHLFRVFRARPGDKVLVMDGCGGRGEAEVIDKKQLRFTAALPEIRQEIELDLYCAIPKKTKLDSLLPQLPGLGVRSLHPLLLEHSVATGENPQRWELLLREGCKQSGNPRLPRLYAPVTLDEALDECKNSGAALYYGSVTPAPECKEAPGAIRAWFVGPEGGFTAEEEQKILAAGGIPMKLGSWIMRLESAAVAGLAVLSRALPLLALLFTLLAGCGKTDVSRHPLMIRADRCRAEGEFELARNFYARLLRKAPNSPAVCLKLATLCDEALNDPVGAIYHYDLFLKYAPNSPDAPVVREYRQMARAKLLRELRQERLPQPPAAPQPQASASSQKDRQLLEALKRENNRMAAALVEMNRKYNALRSGMSRQNRSAAVGQSPRDEKLYTVRSGDTLSAIAHAHGVALRQLITANGLTPSTVLRRGQVLKIPR